MEYKKIYIYPKEARKREGKKEQRINGANKKQVTRW